MYPQFACIPLPTGYEKESLSFWCAMSVLTELPWISRMLALMAEFCCLQKVHLSKFHKLFFTAELKVAQNSAQGARESLKGTDSRP